MYSALKYPESDWRQDAVRFFDTDEHRAYRIENNDDYEPPSYQYDSELDYDSDADIYSNHGESDDSVDEFRRDRHRYYRRYDGWDSERQYGSDFINWKNDLLNQLELEASKDWDYTDESPSPPRWEDVYPEPELRGPPDYDS
ncbi:uncharacterized protein J4E87_011046 [Alternaria ethzedia]|uniref:uncharacterized protein n=1 Tax=Alternaria ethzedia TaxID=181014 RepID=UPI0020C47926|nr:uncharacterized protein J4E87_011046 [Alternaria ethzedia]KAI4609438.1 hypothetical protein J4E87_011046 [Alternaria ethzedia]